MVHPGRIGLPSSATDADIEVVANTPLFKRPVVDNAEPLRARDLVIDVSMDDKPPPRTPMRTPR